MKHQIKITTLYLLRLVGGFYLARKLTQRHLKILCYHGIALGDEHKFMPGVFMTSETFKQRLQTLKNRRYNIIGLDEAITAREQNKLNKDSVVITIDDGWLGTYTDMMPALTQQQFPATLYLCTHYVKHQTEVFNVALAYLFWKTDAGIFDTSAVAPNATQTFELQQPQTRRQAFIWALTAGEQLSPNEKTVLLAKIAGALSVDIAAMRENGMFKYVSDEQAQELDRNNIRLELHTHRHHFSADDKSLAQREILDNSAYISKLVTDKRTHFCYPSGGFAPQHAEWLNELGVTSATTTETGYCTAADSPFFLNRFLDSETISTIEFEAELAGLLPMLRKLKGQKALLQRSPT